MKLTQTQLACYGLVGSACLLAAALVVQLDGKNVLPAARGDLVLSAENLTFLTTRTQPNEEALFVLDNVNEKLLIYSLDLARKRLELVGSQDLKKLFAGGAQGNAGPEPAPAQPANAQARRPLRTAR